MKDYDVVVSWAVTKTYSVKASDPQDAKNVVRRMIGMGEVCVWIDGFEASDDVKVELLEVLNV